MKKIAAAVAVFAVALIGWSGVASAATATRVGMPICVEVEAQFVATGTSPQSAVLLPPLVWAQACV